MTEEGAVLEVWYARVVPLAPAEVERQYAILSPREQERLARRRNAEQADAFRIAHALVRVALSHHHAIEPSAWRFEEGEHGRPEIANDLPEPRLDANLSHTHGLVACVLARGARVGVDVEARDRRRDIPRLAGRVLSERERGELDGLPQSEVVDYFLEHWTLKEAHLKALGKGMVAPMRELSFSRAADGSILHAAGPGIPRAEGELRHWHRCLSSGHHLAVACCGGAAGSLELRECMP